MTLPPRETFFDSCGVDGIEGIADGENCCPLVSLTRLSKHILSALTLD